MNERLRELAEQAGVDFGNFESVTVDVDDIDRFAELIVKDIAKTVFKHLYNQDTVAEYNEYGWDCLPGDLRTMIEKHFGAEA